jgi:twitching motility protein PilJ
MFLSFLLSEGFTLQINHIMYLFSEIGIGNYGARVEVINKDELGEMALSLNAMLDNTLSLIQSQEDRDTMQSAVMKLLDEISSLTKGDLTVRAEVTEHITGAIADSFNAMAEQLTEIIKGVKDATLRVGYTSSQVSEFTGRLANMSEKQSNQVKKAINVINEITASVQKIAEKATTSAVVSKQSMESAKKGAKAVEDTNQAMNNIRERVQETARAIKRLGESSQEIGNIIQIINDISDRTSILSLNASIQAATAGEAGHGFAVVAEEVQRLAERSNMSTKQIEILVKNIQGDIKEAGRSMDESIQRVVEGSALAKDAHNALQEIETISSQVAEMVNSISLVSKEQAIASETAMKTMTAVGEISNQTSKASKQTALSMQIMSKIAERLRVSVETFKVEENTTEKQSKRKMMTKQERVAENRRVKIAQG